jgi:hypothetical protein
MNINAVNIYFNSDLETLLCMSKNEILALRAKDRVNYYFAVDAAEYRKLIVQFGLHQPGDNNIILDSFDIEDMINACIDASESAISGENKHRFAKWADGWSEHLQSLSKLG